ncbi:MAG: glycoside hydrolase family 16 protein [Clostridia bacterium]|nr:glycoside hydrolase family 16 protein [Clostridia bacterium]
MKRRPYIFTAIILIVLLISVMLVGCAKAYDDFTLNGWESIALKRLGKTADEIDITRLRVEDFIDIKGLETGTYLYSGGEKNANAEGWYATLIDNFDVVHDSESGLNPEIWTTSRHDLRWASQSKKHPECSNYWCSKAVSVEDGKARVRAYYDEDHDCEVCREYGHINGRFTGGFETRAEVVREENNGKREYDSNILWAQAFGYFETSIKFPDMDGMWSAFWLQGNEMREIGFDGEDGTEIDIYESAFRLNNDKMSRMGHALLWNGYGKSGKVDGNIRLLEQNLYDGNFHTFSLLWTPECYVFFIDGYATWASNAGGVCKVPEFLRFTNEIDAGDGYGPHGQKIGQFSHDGEASMYVDYIRVYQNVEYEKRIAPSIDGKPYSKDNNFESAFKSDYDTAN